MAEMTREVFAQSIHWAEVIWLLGLLNPAMILPQLWKIARTGNTAGISLPFFCILMSLQAAFSLHGFFIRDNLVLYSNGAAALSTLITALATVYFRRQ